MEGRRERMWEREEDREKRVGKGRKRKQVREMRERRRKRNEGSRREEKRSKNKKETKAVKRGARTGRGNQMAANLGRGAVSGQRKATQIPWLCQQQAVGPQICPSFADRDEHLIC